MPAELTDTADENRVIVTSTLHKVEMLDERPDEFEETTAPVCYGRVALAEPMRSIKGMSGGPIFSFREVDGHERYWLHAMRSTWIRSERLIKAVLMKPLGDFLKEVVEGKHRHLLAESNTPPDDPR